MAKNAKATRDRISEKIKKMEEEAQFLKKENAKLLCKIAVLRHDTILQSQNSELRKKMERYVTYIINKQFKGYSSATKLTV